MEQLRGAVRKVSKELFGVDVEPELTRPQEQFGDYSTNVALQLAGKLNKSPRQIAEQLAGSVKHPLIAKAEVAGAGFINFTLTDEALVGLVNTKIDKKLTGKEIVVEYSDPNPFKILHVGHLYTSVVGDAIAKLLETAGASVHRVNYGGDVGRHVAITMYAIIKNLGGEHPEKLDQISQDQRAEWLTERYVAGNKIFEEDEAAKAEIGELNKKIYEIHEQNDKNSPIAQIYWTTREWSYRYFDEFYAKIGTHFEKYYSESEVVAPGLKAVKENLGKVFEESDGAVVFKGEVHNMHTRVFINSQGIPTYEAKEVGVILKKEADYHPDRSIVITGNEIYEYMQVVFKAVEVFAPELVKKTTHITHGMVKLAGGVKMSSRKGNIITAEEVLKVTAAANKKVNKQENADTSLGAVKYAFLKNRIGADIIFDPKESVSLEGNSGPYLQYAHARAHGILLRATKKPSVKIGELQSDERQLVRKIGEYREVIEKAVDELMPHYVCTYLYELAQVFNRFYENNRVVGDPRESLRLALVKSYADILKNGLESLNIPAPERM